MVNTGSAAATARAKNSKFVKPPPATRDRSSKPPIRKNRSRDIKIQLDSAVLARTHGGSAELRLQFPKVCIHSETNSQLQANGVLPQGRIPPRHFAVAILVPVPAADFGDRLRAKVEQADPPREHAGRQHPSAINHQTEQLRFRVGCRLIKDRCGVGQGCFRWDVDILKIW